MDARTVTLNNEVFASSATTTIPATPTAGVTYRNITVDATEAAKGWPYHNIVDSAKFNQIMYQITSLLNSLEQCGILPWANLTNYIVGSLCIDAADQKLYKAILASGPATAVGAKQPSLNTNYWTEFGGGGGGGDVSAHNVSLAAHPNGFNHLLVVANNDPKVTLQDTNYTYNVTPSTNQTMEIAMVDSASNIRAGYAFAVSTSNTSYIYIRLYQHGSLSNKAEMRLEYDTNGNKQIYSDFTLTDVNANTQTSGDNSTKVATTAFVQGVVSTRSSGYPNYSAGSEISTSSGTVSQDGYLLIQFYADADVGSGTLTINSNSICTVMSYGDDRWHWGDTFMLPVKQGDTWSVSVSGAVSTKFIKFYPNR